MSRATCGICGVSCYTESPDSLLLYDSQKLCKPCFYWNTILHEKTDEWKRIQDEKTAQIEDLNSSLTFLRLGSVSGQPDDMQHSDVVIVVQGRTDEPLHAHRFILSRKSPVFSTMFDIKMREEETGMISIDDATLPVIRAMINFCYNAEIDFTDEVTPEEVLKVAHKYQISLLQAICEKHLIKTLNKSNLPERLRFAKKFDARLLVAATTKFLQTHFDEVIDDVLAGIS